MFKPIAFVVAASIVAIAHAQPLPLPTMSAPIPIGGAAGKPYGGVPSAVGLADLDDPALLKAHDYVEEEYFISGTVAGQPYTTNVIVRKPSDPAKFSGVVALEPIHTGGPIPLWMSAWDPILKSNDAWVGVGSQRGAVDTHIRKSNPTRYENLTVPPPPPTAAQRPAGIGGLFVGDPISHDILTQTGALLKSNQSAAFRGMRVKYLIMGGASQTGGQTFNYIRDAHAGARMPDGKPIYDGYLPMAVAGPTPVKGGDAAVIQTLSEGDLTVFHAIGPNGYKGDRPDGDAPNDRYRSYQVAGASHLPTRGLRGADKIPGLNLTVTPGEPFTQFPFGPFNAGAYVNLVNWITKGVTPPRAPAILFVNGQIARDEHGNAKGGLRAPYVDVPTVRYLAARYQGDLIGAEVPFTAEKLKSLYKTRADYLKRFNQGIDKLVAGRFILAEDGATLKAEEAQYSPL